MLVHDWSKAESGTFHKVFLKPIKMARVKEAIDEFLTELGFAMDALASG